MAALAATMFGADGLLEGFGRGGKVLMSLLVVALLVLQTPGLFTEGASRRKHRLHFKRATEKL